MLVCAYALALRTPFRLVDDYSDWQHSAIFHGTSNFLNLFTIGEWSTQSPRFRPFFELWAALSWSIFGQEAWIHNLVRLLVKLASFWLAFRLLIRVTAAPLQGQLRLAAIFACLYLFFPNNPEARLAPQETWSML